MDREEPPKTLVIAVGVPAGVRTENPRIQIRSLAALANLPSAPLKEASKQITLVRNLAQMLCHSLTSDNIHARIVS
jgi:hypothetical protein